MRKAPLCFNMPWISERFDTIWSKFLVCNHVTRRPCWMTVQQNFFWKNLHENRVKFPEERKAFVLDIQCDRRDVTCKPAIVRWIDRFPHPSIWKTNFKIKVFIVKREKECCLLWSRWSKQWWNIPMNNLLNGGVQWPLHLKLRKDNPPFLGWSSSSLNKSFGINF